MRDLVISSKLCVYFLSDLAIVNRILEFPTARKKKLDMSKICPVLITENENIL